MKRTLLSLGIGALLLVAPRVQADVSVDFFYNNLSGGNWIDVADYGYCWQPDVAVSNTNWRPYADGYWAYTDLGWTWVSYEDFGWATYHYGRWALLDDYGWVWVPGRDADLEWGPAWVSWRTGGDYIGWAPLPPETINVVEGRPLTGHLDVEFNIGPAYYNFVDVRYIGEPVLRERIIAPVQNITYVNQTVNVTNITYKNRTVYNYGPDISVVNRTSARPIQRLQLDREQNVDVASAAKSGGMTKVQGDRLMVAAPMHINRAAPHVAPPTVKTKVDAAKIDHGWKGVGDEKAQTQFKERLKVQNLKSVSAPTGAEAPGQENAAAGANAATGSANRNSAEVAHGQERGGRRERGTEGMTAAGGAQGKNETAGGHGRGQDQQRNRFPQGTEQGSQPGETSSAENARGSTGGAYTSPGGGEGQRGLGRGQQGHQVQQYQNPDRADRGGQGTNDQGQGHQGRPIQTQPPVAPQGDEQGQGGGKRQQERGRAIGQGGGGERQGQGEGAQEQNRRGGKKGEASPAGTPQ
jgi:hypothetical protein